MRGGILDFTGLGMGVLILVVALTIFGVACSIRGFWGTSRGARRLATLAAIFALPMGFLIGAFILIDGYDRLAMLGPAATPADEGYVWRRALSPAIAAVVAFCVITLVAGVGWVREREPRPGDEPPPRKPAR